MIPRLSKHRTSRSGFTLVELLVTIGIMSLLVTLLVTAAGPAFNSAKEKATKVTIALLDSGVKERTDALILSMSDDTKRSSFRNLYRNFQNQYYVANSIQMPAPVAEAFVKGNAYKGILPQRREDLYGYDGTIDSPPGSVDDSPLLQAMWNTTSGAWLPTSWMYKNGGPTGGRSSSAELTAESSELLYMALTANKTSPSGTAYQFDVGKINPQHIGDTDDDGNLEFLDGWGQPLQIYNFPTRLLRPGGLGTSVRPDIARLLITALPSTMNADPHDPTGSIVTFVSTGANVGDTTFPMGSSGGSVMGFTELGYHTPNTYWTFLIVSAGSDNDLDLYLPNDATAPYRHLAMPIGADDSTPEIEIDNLGDNLSNRQD